MKQFNISCIDPLLEIKSQIELGAAKESKVNKENTLIFKQFRVHLRKKFLCRAGVIAEISLIYQQCSKAASEAGI